MKQGWKKTELGLAFTTVTGGTPPKSNEELYGDHIPFVKPPELRDSPFDEAEDGLSRLGSEVARIAPANSILVSCIGNLGKIGLNKIPVAFNQQINAILPDEGKALPAFMYYQTLSLSFKEQLESLASGTTVRIVNKSKFNSIRIVLPTVHEQQRIVAILDEAFAGIATATANAEKNLQNARELFESTLQSVFAEKGVGWVTAVLSDICDVRDGTHDSPKYIDNGIPFVTQKNIKEDGLSFNDVKYISESDHEKFYKRSNVSRGDILISMIGANRGESCLVDDGRVFSIKNVGLIKESKNINMMFLLYYLKSGFAKSYIESESKGGAQPFIGLKKLREFPIIMAPSDIQVSIVSNLTRLRGETRKLEDIYIQKLNELAELKQSILQKAFAGELH